MQQSVIALKRIFLSLFGVSVLQGGSLPATSTSKNQLKIFCFKVEEFSRSGFLVKQGKNAVNPFGFTSILTMGERKSTRENQFQVVVFTSE